MSSEKLIKGRPLHERVIVQMDESIAMTAGGIFLPAETREVVNTGTIVAIGNLVNSEGENLKEGDRIMTQRRAGMPFEIDGKTYTILMKNDIIFVYDAE